MKHLVLVLAAVCVFKTWVEGPRWAHIATAVEKYCFVNDLENYTTEDVGWIRTTTYIKVRGECSVVEEFKDNLHDALEDWNKH